MSTVQLTYNGPADQSCPALTKATGLPLEPDTTYEVDKELAEQLAASHDGFAIVGGGGVTVAELRELAKAAGLSGYSGMTKAELEQALADHKAAQEAGESEGDE